ncbi:aspartic peptidase domain-containing protein [Lophiotrema nucula]|uniref:Aspartic peptidase domain-containing protein n=1 Tax=Lophiotrema nucula TaxID=690887 RepID=A0A6A5ZDP4_9PLEO|nr:aspartic peptidase domain-containing protein [Lophiotrema nucula]
MVSLKALVGAPLLLLASGAIAVAADRPLQDTPGGGVVKLNLHARQGASVPSKWKRQFEAPTVSYFTGTKYYVNLTVGSNNQTIPLQYDTGSPITWMNPDCSTAPDAENEFCNSHNRYNPLTSNTARLLGRTFNHTYGPGTTLGAQFMDDLSFGGAMVGGYEFGVASSSQGFGDGIFGGGLDPSAKGQVFIDALVAQGRIKSRAVSFDFRTLNRTGSIIYGGFDSKKYKCKLEKITSPGGFNVYLTGIGQTLPNGTKVSYPPTVWNHKNETKGHSFFVDTGSNSILDGGPIYSAIGADYPGTTQQWNPGGFPEYRVPCEAPAGSIDFTFGKITIQVSYRDMEFKKGAECYIPFELKPDFLPGIGMIPDIIGATFLRGAYVVFDLDNKEVWMGESADCGSHIVPISMGKGAVPVVPGCGCETHPTSSGGYKAPPKPTNTKHLH